MSSSYIAHGIKPPNIESCIPPRSFISLSSWKRKQTSYWSKTEFFLKKIIINSSLEKIVNSEFIVWCFDPMSSLFVFVIVVGSRTISNLSTHLLFIYPIVQPWRLKAFSVLFLISCLRINVILCGKISFKSSWLNNRNPLKPLLRQLSTWCARLLTHDKD